MIYSIRNEQLQVSVETRGGSLWSIQDNENTEYLWQGDPKYWGDRAPNLFPYIARLTEGKYLLDGTIYHMDIHGFIKDCDLQVKEQRADSLCLYMKDTPQTYSQYPYRFSYEIHYCLHGKKLHVTYHVENLDEKTMYFGIGGHPGFQVPLEEGLTFEDYYLQFPDSNGIHKVGMTSDCFVNGKREVFSLEEGRVLPLKHTLFDDDAIILDQIPKQVSLLAQNGRKGICVSFPQMRYLGLWHKPKSDAPYLCIEPWSSLPSRKDVVEDLAKQEDLISLESHKSYDNQWEIETLS